jgi:hypothetical protein
MLESVPFESPRLWLSIALFSTFIPQRIGEREHLTFGEKHVCANLGFAQSRNHIFPPMSNCVSL